MRPLKLAQRVIDPWWWVKIFRCYRVDLAVVDEEAPATVFIFYQHNRRCPRAVGMLDHAGVKNFVNLILYHLFCLPRARVRMLVDLASFPSIYDMLNKV